MNISTFKDEHYADMDKIGIFSWIIHIKKGRSPRCVYENERNPKKLLELAHSLEAQKASFARLFDETLSDTEFFQIYKQFYRWDTDAIIANCNQSAFPNPKTSIIKTSDVTSTIESEGHGRDFSWWTEWRNSAYEVLTNEDFQLEDRVYSKQEIAELVRQKKLIVLRDDIPYGNEIDGSQAYKTSKQLEPIQVKTSALHPRFSYYGYALTDKDIKAMYLANPSAFSAIRQDLTSDRLTADYEKYLVEYNRTMGQIDTLLGQLLKAIKEPKADSTADDIKDFLQRKKNNTASISTDETNASTTDNAEMLTD